MHGVNRDGDMTNCTKLWPVPKLNSCANRGVWSAGSGRVGVPLPSTQLSHTHLPPSPCWDACAALRPTHRNQEQPLCSVSFQPSQSRGVWSAHWAVMWPRFQGEEASQGGDVLPGLPGIHPHAAGDASSKHRARAGLRQPWATRGRDRLPGLWGHSSDRAYPPEPGQGRAGKAFTHTAPKTPHTPQGNTLC